MRFLATVSAHGPGIDVSCSERMRWRYGFARKETPRWPSNFSKSHRSKFLNSGCPKKRDSGPLGHGSKRENSWSWGLFVHVSFFSVLWFHSLAEENPRRAHEANSSGLVLVDGSLCGQGRCSGGVLLEAFEAYGLWGGFELVGFILFKSLFWDIDTFWYFLYRLVALAFGWNSWLLICCDWCLGYLRARCPKLGMSYISKQVSQVERWFASLLLLCVNSMTTFELMFILL